MSLKRQAEIIKTVQEHPHRSYLIYGDPGTGKTHLAASLYRSHLADWANSTGGDFAGCPIWRVSAPVLLEQWVARSTDSEAPRPDVSERSIVSVSNSGMRPVLFLDEIDKVRGSDYKMEKLRAIVDAVYEAQGQIVATSNTDPESIAAKWGGEWADIILRRIAAPPEGMVLQFQVAE
jgi:AAA+ superfamily predicted ATPase